VDRIKTRRCSIYYSDEEQVGQDEQPKRESQPDGGVKP